jgi:hypothetical protein
MNLLLERRQIEAVAEQIAPMCDGDEELLHDMMTGETSIDWIAGRLHEQIARDTETLVGIAARQAAIAERKERIEARIAKFKQQIGLLMRAARLTKLTLPEATYSVRTGKAKLTVVDPEAVPEPFQRVKAEPDKTKINEHYAEASELPNWLVRTPPEDVVSARTK